jgi:hypothetical protein
MATTAAAYCFDTTALPEWGIDSLTLASDSEGRQFFPVKPIVAALALSREAAVSFLKTDSRTAPGLQQIRAPSRGGAQDTLYISKRALAIWLAVLDPRLIGPRAKACGRLEEFQAALWQLADRFLFRGKIAADALASGHLLPVSVPLSGAQTAHTLCPICGGAVAATVEQGFLHLARMDDAGGAS